MFVLKKTARFDKKLQKLLKKNADLKSRIGKTLKQLITDPKHPGLRTHQIRQF
jgi:mRNA-degrading endonuclease YafQ of YafQ-DinJ toxin-antitoxin module